ncbi:hypothetical protein ACFX14_008661 [Malus domestica]
MDSCDCNLHLVRSLPVFKNTINHGELIRSLHVHRLDEGKRNKVEREFVFIENGLYVELTTDPLMRLMKFPASQVLQGHVNSCWVCIFAFHKNSPSDFTCIPSILSVSMYHFQSNEFSLNVVSLLMKFFTVLFFWWGVVIFCVCVYV